MKKTDSHVVPTGESAIFSASGAYHAAPTRASIRCRTHRWGIFRKYFRKPKMS
jgi:hypothetical protein